MVVTTQQLIQFNVARSGQDIYELKRCVLRTEKAERTIARHKETGEEVSYRVYHDEVRGRYKDGKTRNGQWYWREWEVTNVPYDKVVQHINPNLPQWKLYKALKAEAYAWNTAIRTFNLFERDPKSRQFKDAKNARLIKRAEKAARRRTYDKEAVNKWLKEREKRRETVCVG